MQYACRQPTLNDERAKTRPLRERGVEVEWVVVAGELGEDLDVLAGKRQRAARALTDRRTRHPRHIFGESMMCAFGVPGYMIHMPFSDGFSGRPVDTPVAPEM